MQRRANASGAPPRKQPPARAYMFPVMFWPLIGGFIAFVLIAIILGRIMDPDRRR